MKTSVQGNKKKSQKKKTVAAALTAVLMAGSLILQPAAAPSTVLVLINGTPLQTDQPAVIRNSRTMVPFNAIFSALGAEVSWSEKEQKVTGKKGDLLIELFINKDVAQVNGKKVKLDAPVQIIGSRTMVPLKFVSSNLGAEVTWDGVNYIAGVNTSQPTALEDLFAGGSDPSSQVAVTEPAPILDPAPALPKPEDKPPALPEPKAPEPAAPQQPPAQDGASSSEMISGTYALQNLQKEKFVVQFGSKNALQLKNLGTKKESSGSYTVSGTSVSLTSDIVNGSFVVEKLRYNNRDIILLKDAANGKRALAMTPIPYEDFKKIWAGEKK
ncbi:MAG: copper amine oxidase N-terminal domain-containing protein [Peptostreptococcaceae bacterium]|nr:copper amine oxidase N-terminal domain-containing protein [Peptostreptococcaceae bacterium]